MLVCNAGMMGIWHLYDGGRLRWWSRGGTTLLYAISTTNTTRTIDMISVAPTTQEEDNGN